MSNPVDPAACVHCAPTRRAVMRFLAGAACVPSLAGCDQITTYLASDETVERLGLETWASLRQRVPVTRDAEARDRVANIARRLLLAAGERPDEWEVEVFAQPEANAFVLPGRKIGVFEGLLQVAEDDGELAAVIGHEIGHLQAEHPRERVVAEMVRQGGLRLVSHLLQINDVAFAQEIAGLLGVGAEFGLVRPFSRVQELEADRLGLFLMAEAGYNPREAAELWRRMPQASGRFSALLSTHPAPQDRIEAIEALVPEAIEAATGDAPRR